MRSDWRSAGYVFHRPYTVFTLVELLWVIYDHRHFDCAAAAGRAGGARKRHERCNARIISSKSGLGCHESREMLISSFPRPVGVGGGTAIPIAAMINVQPGGWLFNILPYVEQPIVARSRQGGSDVGRTQNRCNAVGDLRFVPLAARQSPIRSVQDTVL